MSKIIAYICSMVTRAREFVVLKTEDVAKIDEDRLMFTKPAGWGEPMRGIDEELVQKYVAPRLGLRKPKVIGRGGFSTVFSARDNRRNVFAIKVQKSSHNDYKCLVKCNLIWEKEATALETVKDHDNFVHMLEVLLLKHRSAVATLPTHLALKMEYYSINVSEMAAFDYVAYQGVTQLTNLLLNLCEAVRFLHSKRIVHHDIKGENIMVATTIDKETFRDMSYRDKQEFLATVTYKVIDLGVVEYVNGSTSSKNCGTFAFLAPEKFAAAASEHYEEYDPFVAEAYSVGCVALQVSAPRCFTRFWKLNLPDDYMPVGQMFKNALGKGEYEYLHDTQVLWAILRLLANKPNERITVAQAIERLTVNEQ